MKRIHYIIVLLLAGCVTAAAQSQQSSERYSELIERTEGLPAYEALYHMLAYQRFHPDHAPIYYRMGDVVYGLLPSKDALHNYDERAELLYKARLFYGNCLHFLDGRMPRGEAFPTVTPAGKRVEYADVENYLRARLDTLNRWRAETDTLHDRFYRMVDDYESCRQMFLQFMQKYPSEKMAHLCLTEEGRKHLMQLGSMTKRLEKDKQLFIKALDASPVPYYSPQFRQLEITVYRMDGITSSDFLANDIPMWDYAEWTKAFMDVHENTYMAFMRELVQEFNMLDASIERFRLGQPVQIEPNASLPYRVERFDYHSPVSMLIRLEQTVAATTLQAADSLTTNEQIADPDLSARITAAIVARERLNESRTLLKAFKKRIDTNTADKYGFFLHETKMVTVERMVQTAEQAYAFQQELTQLIEQQLHNYAEAYPKQFAEVDISDDKAASDAAEGR